MSVSFYGAAVGIGKNRARAESARGLGCIPIWTSVMWRRSSIEHGRQVIGSCRSKEYMIGQRSVHRRPRRLHLGIRISSKVKSSPATDSTAGCLRDVTQHRLFLQDPIGYEFRGVGALRGSLWYSAGTVPPNH